MDRVRGLYFPIVLALMATLVAVLGSMSSDQARDLALRASAPLVIQSDVAPRAAAEARKRVLLKRAAQAKTESLVMYGTSFLLFATAALLVVSHLRMFRG